MLQGGCPGFGWPQLRCGLSKQAQRAPKRCRKTTPDRWPPPTTQGRRCQTAAQVEPTLLGSRPSPRPSMSTRLHRCKVPKLPRCQSAQPPSNLPFACSCPCTRAHSPARRATARLPRPSLRSQVLRQWRVWVDPKPWFLGSLRPCFRKRPLPSKSPAASTDLPRVRWACRAGLWGWRLSRRPWPWLSQGAWARCIPTSWVLGQTWIRALPRPQWKSLVRLHWGCPHRRRR